MKDLKKKILFIAWDNPKVSYLEGLFVPIFDGLMKAYSYEFHIIQFSWADEERISFLTQYCAQRNIAYTHVAIIMKPLAILGKYVTLHKGKTIIDNYIRAHHINIVIPRSTMPARMMLAVKAKNKDLKVIFDADGLPIEERIDFASLKVKSLRYNALKKIEKRMIQNADKILTRTHRAIDFLNAQYQMPASKYFVVRNGSDKEKFRRLDDSVNQQTRDELGIPKASMVCVYSGSMGPQYGVEQMLYIHRQLLQYHQDHYLLILTNNPDYITKQIKSSDINIIIKRVAFSNIPKYLSIANVAFAIRKATLSMQGVGPIKLGEYLLMGLPVVASAGIGDSDELFDNKSFIFLLKDYSNQHLDDCVEWIKNIDACNLRDQARSFGEHQFSLEQSILSYRNALINI